MKKYAFILFSILVLIFSTSCDLLGSLEELLKEGDPGDNTALIDSIASAQSLLDSKDVGDNPGNVPQLAKDAFTDAIAAAQVVADHDSSTQAQIDGAVSILGVAKSIFNASVISGGTEGFYYIYSDSNTQNFPWSTNGVLGTYEGGMDSPPVITEPVSSHPDGGIMNQCVFERSMMGWSGYFVGFYDTSVEPWGKESADFSEYKYINLSLKFEGCTSVYLKVNDMDFNADYANYDGVSTDDIPSIYGAKVTDLGNGWKEYKIPLTAFPESLSNKSEVSNVLVLGDPDTSGTVYMDNLYFTLDSGDDGDEPNYYALNTAIASANTLNNATTVGSESGQVPQSAKDSFIAAIATAQGVANNGSATQSQINVAVTALGSARTTFDDAIIISVVHEYIYSTAGTVDIATTQSDWGTETATNIAYNGESTFNPCIQLIGMGGWGTTIAFTDIPAGKFAEYNTIDFKVKTSDFSGVVKVKIHPEERSYNISNGTALENGWVQMSVAMTDFGGAASTGNEFAIFGHSGSGTLYVTDIAFSVEGDDPVSEIEYPATNPDTYSPGAGWTLTWSDEFNDGFFDTNTWTRQEMLNPPNDEWEQYYNSSDHAYEEDGSMIIKATWDGIAHGDNHYDSGRIISNPGGQNGYSGSDGKTFLYGKIAARVQLPYGKGIWPAFWTLGDNIMETGGNVDWPYCGEIDILEGGFTDAPNYGQGTVSGTLHSYGPGGKELRGGYIHTLPAGELLAEKFHVFEIEWSPSQIAWSVDGVLMGKRDLNEHDDEFRLDQYVIFNIAVSGWFTDDPDHTTTFPQYMYIDWIRHYTN